MKSWLPAAAMVLPLAPLLAADVTETPFLIEPGSWFVEVDAVRWSKDHVSGSRTEIFSYSELLVAHGLTRAVELQLTLQPHMRVKTDHDLDGSTERASGHGDLELRANVRWLGDDQGKFGLSLLPFVSVPIGTTGIGRDEFALGMIIPAAWHLSETTTLGVMAGLDLERTGTGSGFDTTLFASAALDFWWSAIVGGYTEIVTGREPGPSNPWATSLHVGGVIALADGLELTAGYNLGLTDAATDREMFIRFTCTW